MERTSEHSYNPSGVTAADVCILLQEMDMLWYEMKGRGREGKGGEEKDIIGISSSSYYSIVDCLESYMTDRE